MATFTDTFKRKEVKYVLNERQHRYVLSQIAPYMELDAFGQTRITSLYFDTPTRDLIARSLEKPLYKEKLRVRWYGTPAPGERAYVEIKKKYKGIVYKRRVGCTRQAAADVLMRGVPYLNACVAHPLADEEQQRESLSKHSFQIAEEIKQFTRLHAPLQPSMYIQCERKAFALREQEKSGGEVSLIDDGKGAVESVPLSKASVENSLAGDLRITFDSGIAYRDAFAEAEGSPAVYRPLLAPGEVIMEIKTSGAFPFWLVDALNECVARPSSFSKYGTAYTRVMSKTASSKPCVNTPKVKEACCA